ncbi:MAG TPA: chlorite dismutase family protein [Polyangiaceae bacterium]
MSASALPAPPRVFASFVPHRGEGSVRAPAGRRVTRYVVDRVNPLRGSALEGVVPRAGLIRIESEERPAAPDAPLTGVTTHLVYTSAAARRELTVSPAPESGPTAVLIPITKSPAWWALAQDERQAHFERRAGHLAVGMPYTDRIFRRLYHARHLPGSTWDFLTYFEFPRDRTEEFETLLAALRDPQKNPEWTFVERETEVWMTKVAPAA